MKCSNVNNTRARVNSGGGGRGGRLKPHIINKQFSAFLISSIFFFFSQLLLAPLYALFIFFFFSPPFVPIMLCYVLFSSIINHHPQNQNQNQN